MEKTGKNIESAEEVVRLRQKKIKADDSKWLKEELSKKSEQATGKINAPFDS